MSSPLYSLPFINAVVFGVYATTKGILDKREVSKYTAITTASLLAAFFNAFIAGPVELFKTKL